MDARRLHPHWASRALENVMARPPAALVVDLSRVSFIDSAAYGQVKQLLQGAAAGIPDITLKPCPGLMQLLDLRREVFPEWRISGAVSESGATSMPPPREPTAQAGEVQAEEIQDGINIIQDEERPDEKTREILPDIRLAPDRADHGGDIKDEDVFLIDLDYEKMCLSGEEDHAAPGHDPLTFKMQNKSAGSREEEAQPEVAVAQEHDDESADVHGEQAVLLAVSSEFESLKKMLQESPLKDEAVKPAEAPPPVSSPEQRVAQDATMPDQAARLAAPADGLDSATKDGLIKTLLKLEALRAENERLQSTLQSVEHRCRQADARVQELENRVARHEDAGEHPLAAAWDDLAWGRRAWEALLPCVQQMNRAYQREGRLDPGKLLAVADGLLAMAKRSALAVYGPVLPFQSEDQRLPASLGMAAALARSLDLPDDRFRQCMVVCLLAEWYQIMAPREGELAQFVSLASDKLDRLDGIGRATAGDIRGFVQWSNPARIFLQGLLQESMEVQAGLKYLVHHQADIGTAPVQRFFRTFGRWPRGSWVRLTNGTMGYVTLPLDAQVGVISMCAATENALRFIPPRLLLAGQGLPLDVIGSVSCPLPHLA